VNPKAAVFLKLKTKSSRCQVGLRLLYKIELAVGKLVGESKRKRERVCVCVCVFTAVLSGGFLFWKKLIFELHEIRTILDLVNNSEVLKDCFVRRISGRRGVSLCSH